MEIKMEPPCTNAETVMASVRATFAEQKLKKRYAKVPVSGGSGPWRGPHTQKGPSEWAEQGGAPRPKHRTVGRIFGLGTGRPILACALGGGAKEMAVLPERGQRGTHLRSADWSALGLKRPLSTPPRPKTFNNQKGESNGKNGHSKNTPSAANFSLYGVFCSFRSPRHHRSAGLSPTFAQATRRKQPKGSESRTLRAGSNPAIKNTAVANVQQCSSRCNSNDDQTRRKGAERGEKKGRPGFLCPGYFQPPTNPFNIARRNPRPAREIILLFQANRTHPQAGTTVRRPQDFISAVRGIYCVAHVQFCQSGVTRNAPVDTGFIAGVNKLYKEDECEGEKKKKKKPSKKHWTL